MIVEYFAIRCDVCRNLMSDTGGYTRANQVPALYQTHEQAETMAATYHWVVTYDDVELVWHALCPRDSGV